ncbi:ABC transporter ATP-binding protein [uncultured Propionibacterium sp.]|uniref:ABC transporter ATP-binding protein n=1 Tax=uncultured Propionibacterium sp. TaxID=218066 RepID=UPI00292E2C6F|nr:ABC transporter ATP-binding protein [uncultured Propionibacterium sp.]
MTQTTTTRANERPDYAKNVQSDGGPGTGRVQEKAVNFGPSLRRLIGELAPHRFKIAVVIAMGIAGVAFNVYSPRLLGRATNVVYEGFIGKMLPAGLTKEQAVAALEAAGRSDQARMIAGLNVVPGQGIDFTRLGRILLMCMALYVLASVLQFLQGYILNRVVQRSVYSMRDQVSGKLDRLPLSYFDSQPRGELLSRITNDIDNIQQTLQQTLTQMLNAVLQLTGVLIMMLTVSPRLAIIAICAIPVSFIASVSIGRAAQKRFVGMWTATGVLNGQVEEAFTGHSLVKVFGRRREVEAEFAVTNERLYRQSFGAQAISAILMPVNFFVGNLTYVAVAVVGGLRVASGQMPLGDVTSFIQYSRMFTQPITQVASMANLLQSGVASAERVFEVLDAAEQAPDRNDSLELPVRGHVEFDHVRFSYSPDKPLIEDLSLDVRPDQQIAIVGPTGAGKTTMVNLLERFYDVDGGRILIDGVDINDVPRAQLRDQLGMVLQDTWLFGGSVRDNIAYGKPGATDEEVRAAARQAFVDRFVQTLPNGYDTVINDEGTNVSAGEKQLLTIARAFISEPAILILDEATSSVDTRTEALIQRAMARLRVGRTSFVIAHRLSTIRDADVILVMEHGDIVEQGSHDELIAARGAYWRLYRAQFAGGREIV